MDILVRGMEMPKGGYRTIEIGIDADGHPMAIGDDRNVYDVISIPADARPVVRGIWEKQDANFVWNDVGLYSAAYKCNRCGKLNIAETNYCPNCGADMREES